MKSYLILFVVVSVIILFLVLYLKLKIKQTKELKEALKRAEADTEKVKAQSEKYTKEQKENEELVQKMHGDNSVNSFNAGLELLHKQTEKGKQRNN